MQKHYDWSELGVEMDSNMVQAHIRKVEAGFEQIGYEVDVKAMVTPAKGSTAYEMGLLVSPDLPNDLETVLDSLPWLTTNTKIAETFGRASASAEMSSIVVRNDLIVQQIIEMLADAEYAPYEGDDADMIQKVIDTILAVAPGLEPIAPDIAAYDIFRKSLGWEAERLLARTGDFKKSLAALDDKGVDLERTSEAWTGYDWPDNPDVEGFQLKSMQRVTSQNLHNEEHEVPHLSYAWTSEGILVADMSERRGDDRQAAAVGEDFGTGKTVVKKSDDGGVLSDLGRPGRVLARE